MTTGYLAGTDSNDLELSYAPEVTWGTAPTAVNYQKVRVNSENFTENKSRTRPGELRADGQSAAAVTQDIQAQGNTQFGISYANTDDLIAGALLGAWTADLAIVGVAGDISAVAAGNKFTSTTGGKFADIVVGQWIKTAGFGPQANNGHARVTVKTSDTDITVAGLTLVDDTPAGTAATMNGSMLRNATTVTTFAMQKRLDTGLGFIYPGTFFTGGQINAARGQFFSGQLDALCKSEDKAATAVGTGFDAAPTNKVMNTVGHFQGVNLDDVAATSKIMSLSTSFSREGAASAFALGSAASQGLGSKGTLNVTGSLEIYFADYALYDDYKAETEQLVDYRVTDTAGNTYIVSVPKLVLGASNIVAGGPNQPVMAQFEWMADPSGSYMLQLDRMAA